MSTVRKRPKTKWTLPNTTNPVGRKCFSLSVPDDPSYIAAYRGAILELASAYNWEDDEAHTAKEVANVMRDCIEAGECSNMEFIQRDCDLFVVIGGVETLIYTAQTCINNNIADGTLAKANSGYLGVPSIGDCHVYEVTVKPGNTFVLPNVVNSGDTVQLSNWQGGATDWGLAETLWICPSGTTYVLGECSDILRVPTLYGTDPLQSAPHLAIIAQIGSTYYDVWSSLSGTTPGIFTVPQGIVNQPIRILMNIGSGVSLTATGEMWGEVVLCNYSHWCKEWDFTLSNGGFTVRPGTNEYAVYLAGNGWSSQGNQNKSFDITSPTFTATTCISVEVWSTIQGNLGQNMGIGYNDYANGVPYNGVPGVHITGTLTRTGVTSFTVGVNPNRNAGTWITINKIRLRGNGISPFGASNC